jgi:hypothetical protein
MRTRNQIKVNKDSANYQDIKDILVLIQKLAQDIERVIEDKDRADFNLTDRPMAVSNLMLKCEMGLLRRKLRKTVKSDSLQS